MPTLRKDEPRVSQNTLLWIACSNITIRQKSGNWHPRFAGQNEDPQKMQNLARTALLLTLRMDEPTAFQNTAPMQHVPTSPFPRNRGIGNPELQVRIKILKRIQKSAQAVPCPTCRRMNLHFLKTVP